MDWDGNIQSAPAPGDIQARWLIFLGLSLMLVTAICLALILILQDKWVRKKASARRIHDAVRDALDEALNTPGVASISKAAALHDTLQIYLGPVLAFNEVGKLVGELKAAIEGKAKPPAGTQPGAATAGAAVASATAGGAAAAAAAAGPGGIAVVTAPPPALSTKEQVRHVRDVLESFHEYWKKDRVIDQLTKAQKALICAPPPPKAAHGAGGHGSGGHGGGGHGGGVHV
jgi:hypothetical protein